MSAEERKQIRQARAKLVIETLHRWLITQRQRVPDGSGTARAIDYSLKRWEALTRYLDDDVPIDNNWVENQPALGDRTFELAVRGFAARRSARLPS